MTLLLCCSMNVSTIRPPYMYEFLLYRRILAGGAGVGWPGAGGLRVYLELLNRTERIHSVQQSRNSYPTSRSVSRVSPPAGLLEDECIPGTYRNSVFDCATTQRLCDAERAAGDEFYSAEPNRKCGNMRQQSSNNRTCDESSRHFQW